MRPMDRDVVRSPYVSMECTRRTLLWKLEMANAVRCGGMYYGLAKSATLALGPCFPGLNVEKACVWLLDVKNGNWCWKSAVHHTAGSPVPFLFALCARTRPRKGWIACRLPKRATRRCLAHVLYPTYYRGRIFPVSRHGDVLRVGFFLLAYLEACMIHTAVGAFISAYVLTHNSKMPRCKRITRGACSTGKLISDRMVRSWKKKVKM